MNPALKQLLGEMIDTVAESNPGLARAWHKLLEASCSADTGKISSLGSSSSSPPTDSGISSRGSASSSSTDPLLERIKVLEDHVRSLCNRLVCEDLLTHKYKDLIPCSADCSAGSGGTDGVTTAGEATGTATASSANAAPAATEVAQMSADSPPPVPEWVTAGTSATNNTLWFASENGLAPSGYTSVWASHISDRINGGIAALTCNRNWWRRRAVAHAARIDDLEQQVARQMAEIDRMRRETHPMLEAIHTFETGMAELRQNIARQMNKPPTLEEIHALGLQEPDTTTPPSVTAGAEVRDGVEYASVDPAFSDYRWVAKDGYVDVKFKNKCWGPSTFTLEAFAAYIARGELVPVPPEVKP